jgi:hypothetical protein
MEMFLSLRVLKPQRTQRFGSFGCRCCDRAALKAVSGFSVTSVANLFYVVRS